MSNPPDDELCLSRYCEPITGESMYISKEFSRYVMCQLLAICHGLQLIRGQSIKNRIFLNVLLYLQLNQTCHLQSTPLHSWYTARNVFCISGTRHGTYFAGRREDPVSNFLLSPIPSEIGDLLVRICTSGTRKSPQGPDLESRAAQASSKIHG